MKSIAYLPASNQSANASLMTVTNIRSAGANTIKVNTVANAPVKFAGTMGTPHTFTDPVTNETITIISEASAVDFFGSISGSDVIIDQIAAGYTDLGSKVGDIIVIKPTTEDKNNLYNILSQSHNDDGSIKDAAVTYNPTISDYAQTGGIWSALTGLNAAMTALTIWQGGYRGTVAAVASRAFTLSKDTYVDVLRTLSGYTNTFTLVYTEVANGAAAPALAANSVRLAKVVTNGTTVTSVTQTGLDSLGNVIYPKGVVSGGDLNYPTMSWYAYKDAAVTTAIGATFAFSALNGGLALTFPAVAGASYEIMITAAYVAPNVNMETHIQATVNNGGATVDALFTGSGFATALTGRKPYVCPTTGLTTVTAGVMGGGAAGSTIRTDNFMITVRRIG